MVILALDTSTTRGAIALLQQTGSQTLVLGQNSWLREKSHSEVVTASISELLKHAGVEAADLDRLAVGRGPGSFTGIRVAVNIAKTLAYSLNIPVFAPDTLFLLAHGALVKRPDAGNIAVLLNAFKNMVFVATFSNSAQGLVRTAATQALPVTDLGRILNVPHLIVGAGYDVYADQFEPSLRSLLLRDSQVSDDPDPIVLAKLAFDFAQIEDLTFDWKTLQPLYVRASAAEEKHAEKQRDGVWRQTGPSKP